MSKRISRRDALKSSLLALFGAVAYVNCGCESSEANAVCCPESLNSAKSVRYGSSFVTPASGYQPLGYASAMIVSNAGLNVTADAMNA